MPLNLTKTTSSHLLFPDHNVSLCTPGTLVYTRIRRRGRLEGRIRWFDVGKVVLADSLQRERDCNVSVSITVHGINLALCLNLRTHCANECHDTESRDGILDEIGLSCADEGGEGLVVFAVVGVGGQSDPLSIQGSVL